MKRLFDLSLSACLICLISVVGKVDCRAQNTVIIDSLIQELNRATVDSVKTFLLNELSWRHASSDVEKAKMYARRAIAASKKAGDKAMLAESYNNLGTAFDYEGVPDSISKYFRLSLGLKRSLGDKRGEASILNNIGVSHYYHGHYDSSIVYFMESLAIRESAGDSLHIAQSFNNIGLIYRTMGNLPKALEYYLRAARIKEKFDDKKSLLNTYNNLSVIWQEQDNHDSSFFYARKVLQLAIAINDSSEIGSAYGNMGTSHFKKGEYDEAISFLLKAAAIFKKTDHFQTLPLCYRTLADAYAAKGNTDLAIEMYDKSLELSVKQKLTEVQLADLLGLSKMYEKKGNPIKALDFFKRYHDLNKELFNLEKATTIEDLNTKYDTEKKEKEIAMLNAARVKNEAEIVSKNAQRNLFFGLSIAAILVLIIGGYFLIQIRKKNMVIELALEEKGVLIREIHHRVKNNLQMISSLLSLQSRYVQDDKASKALQDSRNRVASVSLIHQRLYQEDNLKGVLMQEYVPQLVDELLATTDSRNIDVKLEIADLNLDIDTVIPLGLVLNELITNVLKYASNGEQNLLHISLSEIAEELILEVKDNGPGVPAGFDPSNTTSYGVKLIRSLSRKLEAEVAYINRNPGLSVKVVIKKYKHAA